MIPRSPLVASLLPLLCPPLLSSPFPLFFVSFRIAPHAICGFCFPIMVVGVDLTLYLVLSSLPLKVTVHTGASVQRRDRCTGRQQGTQLFLIYNCQAHRAEHVRPLSIQTSQTVGSHTHV